MSDELSRIPTSKVERAARMARVGLQVGSNYVKHAVRRATGSADAETSRATLDEANAADLYNTLAQLKGSALKVTQLLSMERSLLPQAYQDQFAMAQHQAPPLSGPLVTKTFRAATGKSPLEIFDTFDGTARAAASIGQVHYATLDGQALAVKVQYPGVATSIHSDLNLIKPIAFRLLGLSEEAFREFVEEVEDKMLEETDYRRELRQSQELAAACADVPHVQFARYYPDLSGDRILTMDWLPGQHLKEFLATEPSQAVRNQVGQALWDFYARQLHVLHAVHADPHPGNFLFSAENGGTVGIIDFGCVKEIPADFYHDYFSMVLPEVYDNPARLAALLRKLNILKDSDDAEIRQLIMETAQEMLPLVGQPFRDQTFDFGDADYRADIYARLELLSQNPRLRQERQPRGVRHFLYVNRTYFGLYTLLFDLRATVHTRFADWRDNVQIPV